MLPVYLQRNLARLLFDFRTGLTAQLLQDPDALGARLASRTGSYTERFRLFCQNTALLGKISVALLSGEDDESPYLLRPTLRRLVAGLSKRARLTAVAGGGPPVGSPASHAYARLRPGPAAIAATAAARTPAQPD